MTERFRCTWRLEADRRL